METEFGDAVGILQQKFKAETISKLAFHLQLLQKKIPSQKPKFYLDR